MTTFGEHVKAAREAAGLTLYNVIGTDNADALDRIEAGDHAEPAMINELSAALNLPAHVRVLAHLRARRGPSHTS